MGGTITLSCPPGFYLQGSALSECQVGTTAVNDLSESQVLIFERLLGLMVNLDSGFLCSLYERKKLFDSELTYLASSLLSLCVRDKLGGSWTPSILTVSCELVVCAKPPPLLHGVTEGDSYNYGDFVMYSCLPGFNMKVQLIIRPYTVTSQMQSVA